MTAAQDAIRAHSKTRIWYLVIGGSIAFAMVGCGFLLTQRQVNVAAEGGAGDQSQPTEMAINMQKEEFKLRSTYPGLVLIVCGTVLAVALVWKGFYFKTQHKDSEAGIPGFTELKS